MMMDDTSAVKYFALRTFKRMDVNEFLVCSTLRAIQKVFDPQFPNDIMRDENVLQRFFSTLFCKEKRENSISADKK